MKLKQHHPLFGNTVYTVDGFDGTAVSTSCSTTGIGTHGEWYKYTPTSDMYIYITSELSQNFNVAGGNNSHDTFVHIFTGTCSNLSCIAGDDDSGYQDTSRTGFSVAANETYYIAWDNIWDSASFDFKIVEIDTDLMITFTNSTINAPGLDRGVVDMNGDHLDDIVSIHSTNITLTSNSPTAHFQVLCIVLTVFTAQAGVWLLQITTETVTQILFMETVQERMS